MFVGIKRIRKLAIHPKKGFRLHRAEFGHSASNKKQKNFSDYYYPDSTSLIEKIAKFHKIKKEIELINLKEKDFLPL